MPSSEYKKEWARKNYEKNIKTYLLRNAKRRAYTRNLSFTLTKDDIQIPKYCPVLGIPIRVTSYKNFDRSEWGNSPSIDRIDNSKGYDRDNIRVISMRANRIKCDATASELRLVYEYVNRDNRMR